MIVVKIYKGMLCAIHMDNSRYAKGTLFQYEADPLTKSKWTSDSLLSWDITKKDVEAAQFLYDREKIDPLTDKNMFEGALYSLLTSGENYQNLIKRMDQLKRFKLNTPQGIQNSGKDLTMILSKVRFPNRKERVVRELADWWITTDIGKRIRKDVSGKKEEEFELRNELARKGPGLGYKCSSLFMRMCGYENIVPLDIWALRFLAQKGDSVRIPDHKTEQGIKKKEYIEWEEIFSNYAREKGISPSWFQLALWCKVSVWTRENFIDVNGKKVEAEQLEFLTD